MRIRTFCKLVESEVTPITLRDTTVVIDGQNFFYQSYDRSGLNTSLGIECDRYASYIKEQLSMFKQANIKCYFLFKGGHENLQMRLQSHNNNWLDVPTFMKCIYKQVLKEMQFEYIECEYESKSDTIELAQRLNCPLISYDIEFCFSGVRYIPSSTLKFNAEDNIIHCGYFLYADFLRSHRLSNEEMATFIVLTNERLFSEDTFANFFHYLRAPPAPYKRNLYLLNWLSRTRSNNEQIKKHIFKYISSEDQKAFIEEENKAYSMIERRESGGLGAACLLDGEGVRIARADPRWFAKGVVLGHVAIDYVNIYRNKVILGAPLIPGFEEDNATLLSLDLIYYAYDLLTNFENDGLTFIYEVDYTDKGRRTMRVNNTNSVRKPLYKAKKCVFENGWGDVRSLGLMEHFLREALQLEGERCVERAPAPARLLLLALAYCARRSPAMPRALPAVALLVHVALDLAPDTPRHTLSRPVKGPPFESRPILDPIADKGDVTEADRDIAVAILQAYFQPDKGTAVDRRLLHSLAQYQQVVLQLLHLNALCGTPLPAPQLARSYNGTLAYRLLHAAERAADPLAFCDALLSPAPTLYAYFNNLLQLYEDVL